MRKINKSIVFLCILGLFIGFSSCRKYEEPEFTTPKYEGPAANHTIKDIKDLFDGTGVDSIAGKNAPDFIVKAVVVSSDAGGNFYKAMVVQDSTGAIEIEINRTGLYTQYQVGQIVYIKCNGLCVDIYGKNVGGTELGYYRMGWIYQDGVGQINANYLDNYISADGLPSEDNLDVLEIDIDNAYLLEAGAAMANDDNVSRLVKIENCIFAPESFGKPLSDDVMTTEHAIASIDGYPVTKFIVRTSNYAKFRGIQVPDSTCTLLGILSKYGDVYQIQLRTKEDIIR